jgi:hypothetical protein
MTWEQLDLFPGWDWGQEKIVEEDTERIEDAKSE